MKKFIDILLALFLGIFLLSSPLFPAIWRVAWDPTLTTTLTAGKRNYRQIVDANTSPFDGSEIRITVPAVGGAFTLDGCSIGESTAGSDFDGAPTRITWVDEGGGNGITIPAGTSAVSDEIVFDFDKTKRYAIHFYMVDREHSRWNQDTGFSMWYDADGVDDTLTVDVTYLEATPRAYTLELLEVLSDAVGIDYYVDATTGDDGDSGLTEELAWETWNFVRAQSFDAGDTIKFKRGETWNIAANEFWTLDEDGTSEDYITITDYGEGAKPILDCEREFQGVAWNNEGGDKWSTPLDVGGVYRVRLDTVDSYPPEEGTAGIDGTTHLWAYNAGTDKLWVYATQNPNDEYTNIKATYSYHRAFYLSNCDYVKIQNLEIHGGFYVIYGSGSSVESNVIIDNCDIYYFYQAIIMNKTGGSSTYCTVENCDIDTKLNMIRLDNVKETEKNCYDLIRLQQECTNWTIKNNTFTGGGHAQVLFKGYGGCVLGSKNHLVENNIFDGTGSVYTRAYNILGIEGKCTGNVFRYNIVKNTNIKSQIGGNNNEFYYNLMYEKHESLITDRSNWSGGLSLEQQLYVCHDNEVYNNVFYGIFNTGLILGANVASNIIKNNIVMDTGRGGGNPDICIWISPTMGANNVIEYNDCYDVDTADVIDYKGTAETVAEADATRAEFANNLGLNSNMIDPANADFRLLMASLCINAGTDVGLTRDHRGRSIRHAPDIGAYEDPTNAVFMAKLFKHLKEKK